MRSLHDKPETAVREIAVYAISVHNVSVNGVNSNYNGITVWWYGNEKEDVIYE